MAEMVRVFIVLDGNRVEKDIAEVSKKLYIPRGWRVVGSEDDPQASKPSPTPTPRNSGKNASDD
jgi:hypothetical protein